jgi:hypothetical protein
MILPVWATDPLSLLITEAKYEVRSKYEVRRREICKTIEVVSGRVIFPESPSPEHQRARPHSSSQLARPRSAVAEKLDTRRTAV